MSENINPLLFSASSSVFDNITATVLLPPQNNGINAGEPAVSGSLAQPAAPLQQPTTSAPPSVPLRNLSPFSQGNSSFFETTCNPVTAPLASPNFSSISNPPPLTGASFPQVSFPPPQLPPLRSTTPSATPGVTPSISPVPTPNLTPRVTPSVTPNITPSLPSGVMPPPPPTFMTTSPPTGPPVLPPGPSAPTLGSVSPVAFMPSFAPAPPLSTSPNLPPFMLPTIAQCSSAPLNPSLMFNPTAVPQTTGLTTTSNQPTTNTWAPPIYGVTPEKDPVVLPPSFENMASSGSSPMAQARYRPVIPHWFYASPGKPTLWKPFSFTDSINLEEAHRQGGCGLVSTDGGRYDVEVSSRLRRPVYWGGQDGSDSTDTVRRCSWFRKGALEITPQPYEEDVAAKLEELYQSCVESGHWQQQVEVTGESPGLVVIASPHSMHHYSTCLPTGFPTSVSIAESQAPDSVKRGADDFSVSDGEADQVDHLLFLVHGIGPVCDLSFRSVEECVDTFRELGAELVSTHFRESVESGLVGRVEVLPVSWHKALHSDADGIDERLKPITLRSIPMLREFTNDTILDVLLYTSPAYCQLIIDTVSSELNRLYRVFTKRHPNFRGGVSVAGHSLGSVILLDILMHQKPSAGVEAAGEQSDSQPAEAGKQQMQEEGTGVEALQRRGVGSVITASAIRARRSQVDLHPSLTSSIAFEMGTAGTGQPFIAYPQLLFQPQAAFMLGSPVAMFLTVRGLTQLSPQYHLPTCPHVFNIFHPYDPVAYRLETLIHPHLTDLRPVLVPHHKGRKRMHLELKDTLERVGSDIKHRIVDSIQSTWNKLYKLYAGTATEQQQQEMEQAVEEQLGRLNLEAGGGDGAGAGAEEPAEAVMVGQLNNGRRIDYVLQEKPYESFTEYIFALQAHLSYWKSEDTMLLMLKEIYGFMGVSCDAKINQSAASNTPPSTPMYTPASSPTTSFAPSVPPPAIPMMSGAANAPPTSLLPPMVAPSAASSSSSGGAVKVLGGRPVLDLSVMPQPVGMDPTAEPQVTGAGLPPPPTGGAISFNRRKGPRR